MGQHDSVPKRDPNTPMKRPDNRPPSDWLIEGAAVVHTTFGVGRVVRVGLLKREHCVWIEFEGVGVKPLHPHYAEPHLRPA